MNLNRICGVFLLVSFAICLPAQKPDKKYKPKNLPEAIDQLDLLLSDKDKQEIFDITEDDFVIQSHATTGRWIRNKWGLRRKQELALYFMCLGIKEPDDMSAIILRCYYRHLHQKDYELERQLAYYDHCKIEKPDSVKISPKTDNKKNDQTFPLGSAILAWVDYTNNGKRTMIEGTVIDWKEVEEHYNQIAPDGNVFRATTVSAKVKVTKYVEKNKMKQVIKFNRIISDELWINIDRLEFQIPESK